MVLFGYQVVMEDERFLVRNYQGKTRIVDGPARITLYRANATRLTRYVAGPGEYLEVQRKDGEKYVDKGPCSLFHDPTVHDSVKRQTALFVNAGEALVIYRSKKAESETEDKKEVERIVLHGPTRYVQQPNEWTHQFVWHGSDPGNKTRKVYGALKFEVLRVMADQTYYNVPEVRTKDDTLLTVKLMIFFELNNVEKMLDNTHDPIGDFINAAASDVVAFCATLSYEEFLEKTSVLNQKTTFPQLCSRAEMIGYQINKVVFRGFHSSDALQNMHDKAIQERTNLRLKTETEEQRQKHLDFQLEKEEERSVRQRQMETAKLDHDREMCRKRHEDEMARKAELEEAEVAAIAAKNEVQLARLAKLNDMGVDLTKVLVAEQRAPDNHWQIDGSADPKVHIHQN